MLAKRVLEMAVRFAARRVDAGIGAQHLPYGVLCDARDPLESQLSRRSRRQLALLGFGPQTAQAGPASALGQGIDLNRLTADLGAPPRQQFIQACRRYQTALRAHVTVTYSHGRE